MRLTRLQAIKITGELWKWLAETGGNDKLCWAGWWKYGDMNNYCPCCEFAIDEVKHCPKCPLLKLWGKIKEGFLPCEANEKSPWSRWKCAETKTDRKKYARIIWKYCEKLLRRGKLVKFFQKILLLFKKTYKSVDVATGKDKSYYVKFKKMNGIIYVIGHGTCSVGIS